MEAIILQKALVEDALLIHSMQLAAFQPLLEKYLDFETNPANESLQKTVNRLEQENTHYYIIRHNSISVGAIRIVKKDDARYRVSPIFVLPEHQGKGIAYVTMLKIEEMYADAIVWELDTIEEEQFLCRFYEGLGYVRTGEITKINEQMTVVGYEKIINPTG